MKEFKFIIDGHKYSTTVNETGNDMAEVTVNGTTFQVKIEKEQAAAPASRPSVHHVVSAAQTGTQASAAAVHIVKAPLPGSIIKVNVKIGDNINVGDELLTMESMKMENSVKSEVSGVIKGVFIEPGKNVMQEDRLIEISVATAPDAPAAPAAPAAAPKKEEEPKPQAPAESLQVKSPLPGSVIKVLVSIGQEVKKGDTLLTLESMKMENAVMAERDAVVKQIAVSAGQNVMQDDLLIVLE